MFNEDFAGLPSTLQFLSADVVLEDYPTFDGADRKQSSIAYVPTNQGYDLDMQQPWRTIAPHQHRRPTITSSGLLLPTDITTLSSESEACLQSATPFIAEAIFLGSSTLTNLPNIDATGQKISTVAQSMKKDVLDASHIEVNVASSKGLQASPVGTILCLPVQIKEKEDPAENGKNATTHGKGKISRAIYTTPKQNLTESLVKSNIVETSHEFIGETPIEVNPLHELPQLGSFYVNNGKLIPSNKVRFRPGLIILWVNEA
ncbi:hypothetical protein ACH5RR_017853 [Cinchona calisaya]|uniref:Uncharacterized protein n=1 Tax=Cinchona calisaya TaxID=153742 RepID=A0ABD2ZJS0_9GENT